MTIAERLAPYGPTRTGGGAMAEQTIISRLTDDKRRLVAAFTEMSEAISAAHWAEVDEVDGFYGWCSCESAFSRRETLVEAEADVHEHLRGLYRRAINEEL